MKNAAAVRDMTLVVALTAIAVTAFATNGAMSEPTWVPAPNFVELTKAIVVDEAMETGMQAQPDATVRVLKWAPRLSRPASFARS